MRPKSLKELALKVCRRRREGAEITVSQAAEVISIISDIAFEDKKLLQKLYINGKLRAKAKG